MGLSASQARLLTITSRKADCEFQSMTLSHQKLALSRDMEAISSEYQNALTATKLVYDYQSMGSREMNLTYNLLMTPSIYNDYFPKLVTDTKNRVILNSAYAAAARAAGIPAEGLMGTPSSEIRNKFVQALASNGVITPATAAQIQAVPYSNTVGLGNTIAVSTSYDTISYSQLLDNIKRYCVSTDYYGLSSGSLGSGGTRNSDGSIHNNEQYWVVDSSGANKFEQGTNSTNPTGDLTLWDLLNDDAEHYLSVFTSKGEELPIFDAAYLQERIAGRGGILDWITDQFSAVLGGTMLNDTALQYAYNQVYDLIYPNSNISNWCNDNSNVLGQDKGDKQKVLEPENSTLLNFMKEIGEYEQTAGVRDHSTSRMKKSSNYLGFYFTGDKNQDWTHKDRNDKSQISISLDNIAKAFLTSFVQYVQGIDKSDYDWQKGNITESKLYNGNDDFEFTVISDTSIDNGGNDLYASFYDTLFNRICTQGWVENAQVDSGEYMAEMLKNGMAFISSISDDGFYYQSTYSNEKNILEVTDDEAIARAEAKYNSEKAKIENKEETLDLKMKNLDTEISSLTQEYETVKNLIKTAIDKSFKRYEA